MNGGHGRSWGFDVLVQRRPTPGARLTGWASYTWGRARARGVRPHAAVRVRPAARGEPRGLVADHARSGSWARPLRAFSGFPRTPVLGLRVAADETDDGRLVPALDAEGRYVYETDERRRLEPQHRATARLLPPRPAPLLEAAGRRGSLALLPRRHQRHEPRQRRPGRPAPRLRPGLRPRPAAAVRRADRRDPVPAVGRRTIPVLSDLPPFVSVRRRARWARCLRRARRAGRSSALVRARPRLGPVVRWALAAGIVGARGLRARGRRARGLAGLEDRCCRSSCATRRWSWP